MATATYTIETTGDVALTAATAKTILSFVAAANATFLCSELSVSFDGTSPTAEPVTVELCSCTEAGAGTSTSQTPIQTRGAARTVQGSGKRNFSAEPTVVTVLKRWLVHPQGGLVMQFPLGREPEQNVTQDSLLIRCTAPATLNAQAYMEVEEG